MEREISLIWMANSKKAITACLSIYTEESSANAEKVRNGLLGATPKLLDNPEILPGIDIKKIARRF